MYLIYQLFIRKCIWKSVYALLKSNAGNKDILELWINKSPLLSNRKAKDDWISSTELMSLQKAEERFLEIHLISLIPAYFLLIWRKTYILYLWKDDSISIIQTAILQGAEMMSEYLKTLLWRFKSGKEVNSEKAPPWRWESFCTFALFGGCFFCNRISLCTGCLGSPEHKWYCCYGPWTGVKE